MKNIWKYALLAVVALGSFSCHGNSGDGNGDGPDEEPVATEYTLQVDKTTIEANGKDVATFTIYDAEGRDVTAQVVRNTSFTNLTTGQRLDYGTNIFTSIIDGEYTFKATVATTNAVSDTKNTVTVKVQNRRLYEKYKQKVGIYKCTGTWCGYCPAMTTALRAVREDLQDNMVVMSLHNNDDYSIYFAGNDLVSYIASARGLSIQGIPTNIYKARDMNGSRTVGVIESIIEDYMLDTPTTSGVKILSATRADGTITIESAMTTTEAGKYDMGCALLLDNEYYAGGTDPSNIYSNIVISTTLNYTGIMSSDYVMAEADKEVTREFTIPNVPESLLSENLRVVVFTIKEMSDGTTLMDNCQVCPVGGSADYEFN